MCPSHEVVFSNSTCMLQALERPLSTMTRSQPSKRKVSSGGGAELAMASEARLFSLCEGKTDFRLTDTSGVLAFHPARREGGVALTSRVHTRRRLNILTPEPQVRFVMPTWMDFRRHTSFMDSSGKGNCSAGVWMHVCLALQ